MAGTALALISGWDRDDLGKGLQQCHPCVHVLWLMPSSHLSRKQETHFSASDHRLEEEPDMERSCPLQHPRDPNLCWCC